MNNSNAFIYQSNEINYPHASPFHPGEFFPEYTFYALSEHTNLVYGSVRNLLHLMELDKSNFNTSTWNPFKDVISPGDSVLIKPNLVLDNPLNQECLTTHPSIIRAIADYVIIALKGKGELAIGDASLQQCNFKKMNKVTGLTDILRFYKDKDLGIRIHLIDFRTEKMITKYDFLTKSRKNCGTKSLEGDPTGYTVVNLKKESNLQPISRNQNYRKFRVTNYDHSIMFKAHNNTDHKYLIPNSVLRADVIINVPKIKSHRKAGLTACLKNSVGINGHKDWLPHHRVGAINEGGDEYPFRNKLKKFLVKIIEFEDILLVNRNQLYMFLRFPILMFRGIIHYSMKFLNKNLFSEGSWYGNDTIWRTIADLNQILLYTDKHGKFRTEKQRKRLYFCDGIIGGEKEGPLEPTPKKMGLLLGGFDPVILDLAIAELINFDYRKIPQINEIFKLETRKVSENQPIDLNIISNRNYWDKKTINQIEKCYKFKPTSGWDNYIQKE